MATTRSAYDVEDPTGLGGWSGGIKSLGQLLMPDASKFAEARYYGAKTRQSAAETAASVNQQWMQQRLLGAQPGSGVPAFTGNIVPQSLPGAGPDMQVPVYQPSGGGTIPVTPPQYPPPLSQVVAPGSPGPAGPGPAMGGAPPGMGLGAIVTGGGAAPSGPMPAIMDPQKTADFVSNPWGPLSTGQQAPTQSSPSPGAPPAPNTTTSNGQVPANDGVLHPGSVTEANGGQKQSGPAGPNGAPAPLSLNLGTMIAMAHQSGMDAASVKQFMSGYVADLYNSGRIDRTMRNELDAQVAQGTIFIQEETTRRTLEDRRLAEQSQTQRLGMTIAEQQAAHERGEIPVFDPAQGPMYVRRSQQNGRRELSADEYNKLVTPVEVQRRDASGNPVPYQYDQVPAWKLQTQGSNAPQTRTTSQQIQGDVGQAVTSAPTPEAAADVAERGRLALGAAGTATNAPDVKSQLGLDLVAQQTVAQMFGPKAKTSALEGEPIQAEARLDGTAQRVLMQRVQQLLQRNPRLAQTPGVAVQQVLAEMQKNGELDIPDRSRYRGQDFGGFTQDPRVQKLPNPFDKNQAPKDYFIIKYKAPGAGGTGAQTGATTAPATSAQPSAAATVGNAVQANQPPASTPRRIFPSKQAAPAVAAPQPQQAPSAGIPQADTRPRAALGYPRSARAGEQLPVPPEVAREPNGTMIRDKITGAYYVIQNGTIVPVGGNPEGGP